MPELPEVEVIRIGLLPLLVGKRIITIRHSGKSLRTPVPLAKMKEVLINTVITDIQRRAKYLLLSTDRDDLLIIHLGMTGKLGVCPPKLPEAKHDHVFFVLDDGMELRYHDTRRFGSMHVIPREDRKTDECFFFQTTGPEPFDETVTSSYLKKKARNSSQPIKTFIMNSRVIAGVGNIYANESLFAAGIHPRRPAGKLTLKQWQRLLDEIRAVLKEAIACGGSTISDFVNAGGERGYFQMNFRVYGRANQPCRICENFLQKTVITGRASYFCAHCQKR